MKESNFQTLFGKYLTKNPPRQTEVYELKFTKTKSMRWDNVKEHQIEALLKAEGGHLYHKITDSPTSWGAGTKLRFTSQKPFDCMSLVKTPAFVVIWFYVPRAKKVFHKIPAKTYGHLAFNAPKKSFREEDITEHSVKIHI